MEGNQMKMREALEMARDALKSAEKYVPGEVQPDLFNLRMGGEV